MEDDGSVPITLNVPIEVLMKEREEDAKDSAYELVKNQKIKKEYDKPKRSKFRKVCDYLSTAEQSDDLTYDKIANDLMISKAAVVESVKKSNFWNGNNMTWIPVPKKKGTIQLSGRNLSQYEDWDIKKGRTITTMKLVKDKAEHHTAPALKAHKRQRAMEEAKEEDKRKLAMIQ